MGIEALIDRLNGQVIDQDVINLLNRIIKGDFVGRDSTGAATAGQNLGTTTIPWGTGRFNDLIIGGFPVDPALVAAPPNRVVSGAIRSTSNFPDFLRPAGVAGGASFTVLGDTTTLRIDVNGIVAEITTDIVKSSLTLAPAANNTCLINDTALGGEDVTRFLGENGLHITVDNMGSELTGKIGEFVALLNQTTDEIIYCRIASASQLDYARRGFFFDDSGDPIEADVLNNNDVLQILSLGFIFAEDDSTTIDVTYSVPVIGGNEPTSPPVGKYWYDMSVNAWKRYGGATFDEIDRTFIGAVVIDTADCIGTRPEYFTKAYRDDNSLVLKLDSVNIISSDSDSVDFLTSVDGNDKRFDFGFLKWDASTDFESGVTRTVSRYYWLYLTEEGLPIISDKKPFDLVGFLRGWYHPYNSWRAVAQVFNNSSNEFEIVNESDSTLVYLTGFVDCNLLDRVILSNNVTDPDHDVDSALGKITLSDNSKVFCAPAFTKLLDANWSLGNGNGASPGIALGNDTTYYYFAITSADGLIIDYGIDTSITAANLLSYAAVVSAGITMASYQGSLRTDGAANIRGFKQNGRDFTLNDPLLFASGGFTDTSAPFDLDTKSPLGIVTRAKIAFWIQRFSGVNTMDWSVISTFQTPYKEFEASVQTFEKTVELYTDTSSQIRLDVTSTTGFNISDSDFHLLGWLDDHLKE